MATAGTAGLVTIESLVERIIGISRRTRFSPNRLSTDGSADIDGLALVGDETRSWAAHDAAHTTVGGMLGRFDVAPEYGHD
jgi:hypothetical protein